MKKFKWICGIFICAGLVAMITGGGIFYARRLTAYKETKIKPMATQRLSVFNEIEQKAQFRLAAHRGLSAKAPENSLEAIRMAGEAGFRYVQLDVAQTKDGVPMLLFDPTVDRMTNGTGRLGRITAERASELVLDNGANIDDYNSIHIPQLGQALSVCAEYGITPWLSVRFLSDAEQFRAVLQDSSVPYVLFSDRKEVLSRLKQMGERNLCYIVDTVTQESLAYAVENSFSLAFDPAMPDNTDAVLHQAREAVPLYARCVNDRAALRRMEMLNIRNVTTDRIIPVSETENGQLQK